MTVTTWVGALRSRKLVLASLADGPKHGYAGQEDIARLSGSRPGPGTLYGAVGRLEERGLIERLTTDDRRKPYRITPAGAEVLAAELRRLQDLSRIGLRRLVVMLTRPASARPGCSRQTASGFACSPTSFGSRVERC